MDFSLDEQQVLFRDTIARYLMEQAPFEKRQEIIEKGQGYAGEHWQALSELGIVGLPYSEDSGGLGGTAFDVSVIMRELGKSLLTVPYLSSSVLAGRLLEQAGGDNHAELRSQAASGDKKLAFAYAERGAGYDFTDISCRAESTEDGFTLTGNKVAVLHAESADHFIVLARTDTTDRNQSGLSLFLVSGDASGLVMTPYAMQDGNRAAEVSLEHVRVGRDAMLGAPDKVFDVVSEALDFATMAVCAEASGIMWAVYELTLEYMKTRTQFGATLGSFQALQHRMVDMYMMCEMAESISYDAAASFMQDDAVQRQKAVSSAKSLIGRYGVRVGQEGIQLHGGIGMTLEYPVGHYFKRLTMIDRLFGDVAWHEARYSRLS